MILHFWTYYLRHLDFESGDPSPVTDRLRPQRLQSLREYPDFGSRLFPSDGVTTEVPPHTTPTETFTTFLTFDLNGRRCVPRRRRSHYGCPWHSVVLREPLSTLPCSEEKEEVRTTHQTFQGRGLSVPIHTFPSQIRISITEIFQ